MGPRKHSSDLPQGGLEVPCNCLLKFKTHDAKECSKTNKLLISLMSEFPEGSSVQSGCTLCTGNSCTKPTDSNSNSNEFIDSSSCSDSTNAAISSHSTNMQSSTTQAAISSEKVIEMLSDDEYDTSDEEETSSTVKKRKLTSINIAIDLDRIIMGEKLSDLKINFAQHLKSQFPDLNGLDSTLLQQKRPVSQVRNCKINCK